MSTSTAPIPTRTERQSLGEMVADHVRTLIFEGVLRDGDRVPQREIAEALGVSAVPVREAVVALEREGVVSVVPHRGAFVNGLDPDVVTEQFYLFGRTYGLALRRATERASVEWIEELAELGERLYAARDIDEQLATSIRIQEKIIVLGGSKRLRALLRPLWRIVPGNFFVSIPGALERTIEGVREIIDAMRADSPVRAEAASWDMMDDIGSMLAEQLSRKRAAAFSSQPMEES